jgi:hypothetical protein
MGWALGVAKGNPEYGQQTPNDWEQELRRFHSSLAALDEFLASSEKMAVPPETLFQAPIADALTHVGQLALLRRMAGGPVRGEDFSRAEIVAGRLGAQQSPPAFEFD